MKKPAKLYRHGKFVRDLDPDSKYVVADGEYITFGGIQFMDSMDPLQRAVLQDSMTLAAPLHRPGAVTLTDSERDRRADMYDAQKMRLSNAYRDVPPLAADVARAPINTDAREDAYEARNRRLEAAYSGVTR